MNDRSGQFSGFEQALAISGITIEECEVIQTKVFETYDTLAESIPPESASRHWKLVKPAHARKVLREVQAFADWFGLSPLLARYIALACSAHDLGRMVQANKRVGTQPAGFDAIFDDRCRETPYDDSDERHGYESVLLLRPILGGFCQTEAGRWLLDAVLHHSLKANPTLEMCGGSEKSLVLCGIVRDIDKVLGF